MGIPEEQLRAEIYGSASAGPDSQSGENPRGGQVGNTNALRHGFYASVFQPAELRRLEKFDKKEVDDEIALLRVLIKRTVASMSASHRSSPGFVEVLRGVRVITFAASCLEKLERTKYLVFEERPSLKNMVMEALLELDPDEDL